MIDWSKPIQWNNGNGIRNARPLGELKASAGCASRFAVAVESSTGGAEQVQICNADGIAGSGQVENIPEKRVVWLNCYQDESLNGLNYGYGSRDRADREAISNRIARVRVEYTVGQMDE